MRVRVIIVWFLVDMVVGYSYMVSDGEMVE